MSDNPPQIPAETMNHLLSLPQILQPLSSSLAALHLARVRLLLSIPTSSSTGEFLDGWCHLCGGLREGLGGAIRGKIISSDVKKGEMRKNRRHPNCSQCGARYQRPKPDRTVLLDYPPARTRAKRKAQAQATPFPNPAITLTSVAGPSSPITLSLNTTSQNKSRPTLLSTPSLTYLPTSAPNPPTYPEPTTRVHQTSHSLVRTDKNRKHKKSGLAKLLAENRERTQREEEKRGGIWGLDG